MAVSTPPSSGVQPRFDLPAGEGAQHPAAHLSQIHSARPSPLIPTQHNKNRFVTGITCLGFLSKTFHCSIVKTPVLTLAKSHRKKNFYTLFIRDSTNNWLREWKVAGALTLI